MNKELRIIQASTDSLLNVPKEIDVCPECKAHLQVDIFEWESDSKKVTESGFTPFCSYEYEQCFLKNNWDAEHRGYQSEWQSVIDNVFNWLTKSVRVNS